MNKYALVIDVESIGLHGQHFSVGYVVIDLAAAEYKELEAVEISCKPEKARGLNSDFEWVRQNVTVGPEMAECPEEVSSLFWQQWLRFKQRYAGIEMYGDCIWPVEARFLISCVDSCVTEYNWLGPYPLHEIASFSAAAGWDPMMHHPRLEDELPAHNSLNDARQSARLLFRAFKKMGLDPMDDYE